MLSRWLSAETATQATLFINQPSGSWIQVFQSLPQLVLIEKDETRVKCRGRPRFRTKEYKIKKKVPSITYPCSILRNMGYFLL